MDNTSKKVGITVMIFAFFGSPIGAIYFCFISILWAVFSDLPNAWKTLEVAIFWLLPMVALSCFKGIVPAVLAGIFFSVWYAKQVGLPPQWKMMTIGFVSGGMSMLVYHLYEVFTQISGWLFGGDWILIAVIGAGAGVSCALIVGLFQINAQG